MVLFYFRRNYTKNKMMINFQTDLFCFSALEAFIFCNSVKIPLAVKPYLEMKVLEA